MDHLLLCSSSAGPRLTPLSQRRMPAVGILAISIDDIGFSTERDDSGVQPAYGASLLICGLPGLGPEPQLGLVCEATYALDGEKLLRVQPKGIGMKKSRMRE